MGNVNKPKNWELGTETSKTGTINWIYMTTPHLGYIK